MQHIFCRSELAELKQIRTLGTLSLHSSKPPTPVSPHAGRVVATRDADHRWRQIMVGAAIAATSAAGNNLRQKPGAPWLTAKFLLRAENVASIVEIYRALVAMDIPGSTQPHR